MYFPRPFLTKAKCSNNYRHMQFLLLLLLLFIVIAVYQKSLDTILFFILFLLKRQLDCFSLFVGVHWCVCKQCLSICQGDYRGWMGTSHTRNTSYLSCTSEMLGGVYMWWFNFVLGLFFIFLLFFCMVSMIIRIVS